MKLPKRNNTIKLNNVTKLELIKLKSPVYLCSVEEYREKPSASSAGKIHYVHGQLVIDEPPEVIYTICRDRYISKNKFVLEPESFYYLPRSKLTTYQEAKKINQEQAENKEQKKRMRAISAAQKDSLVDLYTKAKAKKRR